jgi:hypothetical protein
MRTETYTCDRCSCTIEKLANKGISGVQINLYNEDTHMVTKSFFHLCSICTVVVQKAIKDNTIVSKLIDRV